MLVMSLVLALPLGGQALAQSTRITGQVQSQQKEPLMGVTVQIVGTTTGVVTDLDGNFSLLVPNPIKGKQIKIAFLGMKTQTITLATETKLNITLVDDSELLQDVVVTGYQKTDRRLFTGSSTKVKAGDAKLDGVVDVGRMMEGKAAGVSVQNVSGTFGTAPKIRIRGASSIYGDTKPLWVVDGVVLEDVVDVSPDQLASGDLSTLLSSSVAGLNAEDIEDFQVLKDASATALYGARAMNGVIVITTKRGKEGKRRINYSFELTSRLKPSYRSFDILNSQDQLSVYREMETKGWLNYSDVMMGSNGGLYYQMYNALEQYDPNKGFALENTEWAKLKYLQQYEYANVDWFDELFTNKLLQNHSLSMSGGSSTAKYYISAAYLHDDGWTIADKVKRFTLNAQGEFELNKRISLSLSSKGSYRDQQAPGAFEQTPDVVNGGYSREFEINPFSYALNTSRTLSPRHADGSLRYNRMNYAPFNILDEYKQNYVNLDVLDFSLQGDLKVKLFKDLDYKFLASVRYVKTSSEHIVSEDSNVAKAYRAADDALIIDNNRYLWRDPENPNELPKVVLDKGGMNHREDDYLRTYYLRNTLEWRHTFGQDHLTNFMLGQELRSTDRAGSEYHGYGIMYDRGNQVMTNPNIFRYLSQGGSNYFGRATLKDKFVAFFFNGAYSYQGKYTLNATARVDGSNRLGQSARARWLPTANVSAKWNIKEEKWLQSASWLSSLALRATYGLTASMGPARNSTAIYRSIQTLAPFAEERQNALNVSAQENENLTWEKQYETNVGVDASFLNGRLSLQLDAYKRSGFDLIAVVNTSGVGGEFSKVANYADLESYGMELTLSSRNITSKDFDWTSNFTFAYHTDEITRLESSPNVFNRVRPQGVATLGNAVRGLYSFRFAGLTHEEGIPTFYDKNGKPTQTVNFQSIEYDHLKYEGTVDPKVTGGLSNQFRYGPLALSVFLTYQFGNVIRLNPAYRASYNDLSTMPIAMKDRWRQRGDEEHTDIPSIISSYQYSVYGSAIQSTYNAYNYSDINVAKGDFIRLKELALSYNLPQTWTKKIGINGAMLKLTGTNLFLLYSDSKLRGQDPEFFGAGGVALPQTKQFTFSLKLDL